MMRHLTRALLALMCGAMLLAAPSATAQSRTRHTITYDERSLMIDGARVFIWSGEFHPFRLPSPSLWRDVLQKMKASGYNTVGYYINWGYHSPAPGVYDFSGIRDMDLALRMAEEEGLYVILRPGPYVNAELTRGGFPGWLVNQRARARIDSPEYLAAADEWFAQINAIVRRHQLTDGGGTVILYQIENELLETTPAHARYMQHLYDRARADGITVPIFHNDIGRNGFWVPRSSDVTNVVHGPNDLYAWDTYPGGTCNVDATPGTPNAAPDWGWYGPGGARGGASASPRTPGFTAEFGQGWFDYWGSNGTYPCTAERMGPGYERVFYGTNIANGLTIQNFYMAFGGTSWGWMPGPIVYTSYDYGAGIDETRGLRPKARTLRQMGMFIQAAEQTLAGMRRGPALTPSAGAIKLYQNVNPDNGAHFIFAVHNPSSAVTNDAFTFQLETRDGAYRAPQQGALRVNGQDSKLLLAAYDMERQRLVYSTSQVQSHLRQGGRDIALLYAPAGEDGETVLRYASAPDVQVLDGEVTHAFDTARGDLRLNYRHQGLARVLIGGGGRPSLLLLLADEATGQTFFRQDAPSGAVLARGPALVRTATMRGATLALTGDTSEATELEVWAPPAVRGVSWNGANVATRVTPSGSLLTVQPLAAPASVSLPDLASLTWRRRAGSPEAEVAFDDSGWAQIDNRGSASATRPAPGLPTLTADDYGFHNGDLWYRGRFTGRAEAQRLELNYGAGGGGMLQMWLDGRFVGQNELPTAIARPPTTGVAVFDLPASARTPGEHVISVWVRNNGHNWDLFADDAHKEGRGLIHASLSARNGPNFSVPIAWRVQGARGGQTLPDPVRGVFNNGGQYGERMGWHLPGFPDATWETSAPTAPPPVAGTYWLRTSFDLNLPRGHDVQLGLAFGDTAQPRSDRENRALIFVNGWHMGQFAAHIGPQRVFVIPPGILNLNGRNTIALAVTSDGAAANALEPVRLTNLRTVRGGVPVDLVRAPGYRR